MQPHIFILITRGDTGGAQQHILSLIRHLRHRIRFTLGCGESGYLVTQADKMGVETIIVPHLKRPIAPLTDIRCVRALRQILKRENPDLVHLHSSKAGVVGRLAARSIHIKSLFTAHGWAFTEGSGLVRRSYGLITEWIMARFGDGTIAVSGYDFRLAKKFGVIGGDGSGNRRGWLIPNGVRPVQVAARGKRAHKHSGKPARLLHVGRLERPKNQRLLIEAASMIERDFSLTIVGNGQLRPGLDEQVDRHGLADRVTFVESSQADPYFADADIFVLSSDYEGLPLVILEAMSAGLPIVSTDVGGVCEAVSDGVSGFLASRGDAEGLSEKLTRLIDDEDLRREFGREGRRIYLDQFTEQRMCEQTLAVYQTLIGGNP